MVDDCLKGVWRICGIKKGLRFLNEKTDKRRSSSSVKLLWFRCSFISNLELIAMAMTAELRSYIPGQIGLSCRTDTRCRFGPVFCSFSSSTGLRLVYFKSHLAWLSSVSRISLQSGPASGLAPSPFWPGQTMTSSCGGGRGWVLT